VYYRGVGPFAAKSFDLELRVFRGRDDRGVIDMPVGNMTVGRVVAKGADVTNFDVGEPVYGWLPIADYHVCRADQVYPLGDLSPEAAVCIDPAFVALAAARDGKVSVGDRVAVFGLGAIGLLSVQCLKLAGAEVIAVSRYAKRRALAQRYGADHVIDSGAVADVGLCVKEKIRGGVDIALECSGYYRNLQSAFRAARQCGRIIAAGFYTEDSGLRLGEEFFHNRLTLLASLPAWRWQNPDRDHPLWDRDRLRDCAVELLQSGRLSVDGLLDPVLPFSAAQDSMRFIDEHPDKVVKVAIRY
jgi:threonine dehydrogenase-like Zn-dependent dehydrogenase